MTVSSKSPVRVFIGSGEASVLPCRTLVHSLRRHTNRPLDIWVYNGTHNAIERNEEAPVPAPMSLRIKYLQNTEFSFYRFLVPELCEHDGRAIYLDSDMICYSDIGELFDTPIGDHQFLSKAGRTPETWAPSVMLIDCSRTKFDLEAIFQEVDGARYSIEDFTSFSPAFRRQRPYSIGLLDPRWNEFDRCKPDTKLVHYTNLLTQPWKFPNHPFGELWFAYFRAALAGEELTPRDVSRSIMRGYARPDIMDGNRPGWRRLRRRLGRLGKRLRLPLHAGRRQP